MDGGTWRCGRAFVGVCGELEVNSEGGWEGSNRGDAASTIAIGLSLLKADRMGGARRLGGGRRRTSSKVAKQSQPAANSSGRAARFLGVELHVTAAVSWRRPCTSQPLQDRQDWRSQSSVVLTLFLATIRGLSRTYAKDTKSALRQTND